MSPARPKTDQIPGDLADELDRRLVGRKFSGYMELSGWLNGELEKRGLELRVSHAAIHRHGRKFAERLNALATATQMAKAITAEAGDDEGALNTALLRLAQEKMFQLLLEFDEIEKDDELRKGIPVILQKVTRSIADMSRASVQQNKWRAEFKKELSQKLAMVEKDSAGGDAQSALLKIREIYGIGETGAVGGTGEKRNPPLAPPLKGGGAGNPPLAPPLKGGGAGNLPLAPSSKGGGAGNLPLAPPLKGGGGTGVGER